MHYHPDQGEKGLSARDARLRRQKKDAAVARCYAIVFIIELFVMIVISIGLVISGSLRPLTPILPVPL